MPIAEDSFGHLPDGREVKRFTLSSSGKLIVQVIDYGATVTSIRVPDARGEVAEVTLGYNNLQGYLRNDPYFGVTVGRFANRIAKGKFTLDGVEYTLAVNNGPNHLHGGIQGFDKKLWSASAEGEGDSLSLSLCSPDGDEGYPGQVDITVTYQVTSDDRLVIGYKAIASKATPINLTNHSYFNLDGHSNGNIFDHRVQLKSDFYTPPDDTLIPTGEIRKVDGSLYDLREPTRLSKERLEAMPGAAGFDYNFVIAPADGRSGRKHGARVTSASGRIMDMYTTQPGVQLYTAYFVSNSSGHSGAVYDRFSALCLEAQNYPDAPNKPNFPNSILRPGQTYEHTTEYAFSAA